MSRLRRCSDWLLIILINFMWATQAPVIRWIGDGPGPVAVAFIPMIVSTLLFLPVLAFENRRNRRGIRLRWSDLRHFLVAGLSVTSSYSSLTLLAHSEHSPPTLESSR